MDCFTLDKVSKLNCQDDAARSIQVQISCLRALEIVFLDGCLEVARKKVEIL